MTASSVTKYQVGQVVRQGWKEVEGDVQGEGEDGDDSDADQQVQANRAAPRGPRQ